MQRNFVNSLVGIFLLMAYCHTATARAASLLDVLTEKNKIDNYDVDQDRNLESDNSLVMNDQPDNIQEKKTTRNLVLRKFVKIELEGSHRGVTIEEGQSYELSCNVMSNPGATVYWVLPGENLDRKINELKKQSVASRLSTLDEATLTRINAKHVIDCATKKNEGSLHCVAVAGENVSYNTTVITVEESNENTRLCNFDREPIITYHPEVAFAYLGSKIELPCRAVGSPRPTIRWTDTNGNNIVNHVYDPRYEILDDGTLVINDLTFKDMGGPTCAAASSSGIDSAQTFLYTLAH